MLIEKVSATTLGEILGFNGADPNKGLGDVLNFLKSLLGVATSLAGMIAVVMILYSAFLYVTAYGDDAKAETAKKTIFWAIIGLAVMAFSQAMVYLLNSYILTPKSTP